MPVTIDDDGNVTGADKAITNLAKSKPHLVRTSPAGVQDAATSGPKPTTGDMDDWIRGNR